MPGMDRRCGKVERRSTPVGTRGGGTCSHRQQRSQRQSRAPPPPPAPTPARDTAQTRLGGGNQEFAGAAGLSKHKSATVKFRAAAAGGGLKPRLRFPPNNTGLDWGRRSSAQTGHQTKVVQDELQAEL